MQPSNTEPTSRPFPSSPTSHHVQSEGSHMLTLLVRYREKRLEEAVRVNYNLWPSLSVKLKSHVFILFPVIFLHRWRKPVSVNMRDVLGGSIPTHPRHKELY